MLRRTLPILSLLGLTLFTFAHAADSPQFLGPQRNGVLSEKNLIDAWPENGPPVLWRAPIGVGMSAVAVVDGLAITLRQDQDQQSVVALNAKSGEEKWSTDVAPSYSNSMGDGPRATPTVVGDRVFVFTGEGVLAALQVSDGKLLWKNNVVADNRGKVSDYGMASSPLAVGDLIVVQAGAPGAAVVACDQATGKQQWKVGGGPAGYSSPALLKVGGTTQIVAFAGDRALGLSPQGKTLWSYPYKTSYECNTATPIAIDGNVLLSAGENQGSVLLALKKNSDSFAVSEVWSSQGGGSVLRSEWQTPVLQDGYLYGFDNVGSAGPVSHLTCIEAATGKQMWSVPRFGKGNLVLADGKLFMTTYKGEFVVAEANPKKYQELGRTRLTQATRQAPVLANGLLYLRDNREVVCLDVREK